MRAKPNLSKAYIICEMAWRHSDSLELWPGLAAALCAFRSRECAEQHRQQLERQPRLESVSPFQYGDSFEELCSLSEDQIERRLRALGIDYPEEWEEEDWGRAEWQEWWEDNAPEWTVAQLHGAWDIFDGLRFHDTVEVQVAPPEEQPVTPRTLFAVQRVDPQGEIDVTDWLWEVRGEIVKAFLNHEQAEVFRQEAQRREWSAHNPFRYGESLADLTSMKPLIFRDWLLDVDLELPAPKLRPTGEWEKWWTEQAHSMTEEQRDHVWTALDKVRLFQVVELELQD